MFFEDDSEDRSSLVVNSVNSVIPHSGIRISFNHMLLHLHQIRSDVIESGVRILHINQSSIERNPLRISTVSPFELRIQLLIHDCFLATVSPPFNFLICLSYVSAWIDRIPAKMASR